MHHTTVRAGLRGTLATLALAGAMAGGASAANAAPLQLQPYTEPVVETSPVAEEFTSTGTSTISSAVNAKVACLFQRTFSAMNLDC
ncbi:MAG TPA: hypothetical protein VK083_04525 [Nocardia sp.]|uniref:hypothetical protein n=1 Tax=Nocardia TaxID=1817 RepID=UPI0024589D91|nr:MULTISPECIES: hypothetical protein [Nocardia]HLS76042.1 hypothetical protein [Nocardia sp.]